MTMASVAWRGVARCGVGWRGIVRGMTGQPRCASLCGVGPAPHPNPLRPCHSPLVICYRRASTSVAGENGGAGNVTMDGVRELWPLNYATKMMKYGHDAGTRWAPSLCITNTAKPITPELMNQALNMLCRKVRNARVGIKEKDGQLHYYEVDSLTVDVQELPPGTDVLAMVDELNAEGFASGAPPQWKLRYSEAAPDAIRPMPELTEQFPYQYYLLFFPNHAVFDGTSFALLIRAFREILDSLMCGEAVDESPFGEFVDFSEVENKEALVEERLKQNPAVLNELKDKLVACSRAPLLLRAFPPPGGDNPVTKFAYRRIEQSVFDAAHRRGKEKGISFNSILEAAINTAVVELVVAAGVPGDSFDLSVTHATSLRRFMKKRKQPIMGYHVGSTVHVIPTPRDARAKFWEVAATIDQDLKEMLRGEATIEQEVVRRLTLPSDPATFYHSRVNLTREYGLTNLGTLDPAVPGEGRAVQYSSLILLAVIHNLWYLFLHQLHTYRGVVRYTLSYPSNYVAQSTAELLMDKVLEIIKHICEDQS